MDPTDELREALSSIVRSPLATPDIAVRRERIRTDALSDSRHLGTEDFRAIHPEDLRRMVDGYDREFFGGRLLAAVPGKAPYLGFSARMTRAGGRTVRRRARRDDGALAAPTFEIRVSTTLLFASFREGGPAVRVVGHPCLDRLDALQRILEHELVHLSELLLDGVSSCKREPFRRIAHGLFGHLEHTHDLVTPHRLASEVHGIHRGARVRFELAGVRHEGTVNRITKRATVLVEDPEGEPYSDGKRYRKYLVPLQLLTRV